jgi:GNAT superfamily N-acetyltransferase
MEKLPTIRNGHHGDLEPMVAALSDSFSNDPMLNYVIPAVSLYPDYFRLLLKEVYLPRGMIHMEENARAAALWLPPEERFQMAPRLSLLKLAVKIVAKDGLRVLRRIRQQGAVFEKHLPAEPHYYLQFLGCRTNDQGNGYGSALIKHGTRICDEQGVPAYLESSNELNVPLYARHGFKVIGEELVSKNGPMAWFMWRDPR